MDFNDTPSEAAYRSKVRSFLNNNAELKNPDKTEISRRLSPDQLLEAAKKWQALKADHGFACITWSKEFGGPDGSSMEEVIFSQEEECYDLPVGIFQVGLGVCLPAIIKLGDDATRKRFVKPALRGEEVWCQLFSEPAAGSDLAGIVTRAVSKDKDWIINGQKVWTTNAHIADYGLLLARSNSDLHKHKGMTMFWVDMRTPGIEVRPIHQISGKAGFNEVFFKDVIISDDQRIGEVNGGWKAALVALMNERLAIGGSKGADYQEIIELARQVTNGDSTIMRDSGFRQRLASWYINSEGIKLTRYRALTALSRGQTPGPESSICKIISANQLQDLCNYAIELQGEFGIIHDPEIASLSASFHQGLLKAPGSRVAGGTDEILLNIIAERVLGMPAEIRVDKDKPFTEIPTGL